ncbi:MAG TPA: hypothetical protein VK890_10245 [Bacteroidia bacterium]|nr:hypothetical protein [Bacteroidia bacterium]
MSASGQKFSLAVQQHNFTATKTADNFQNQAKKLPCHVVTVNNDDTVVIAYDITDPTFTLPNMTVPQAYSKYSREPTQVGDKGYVVPNDVNLGGESGLGGGVANLFQRANLTTGVFHPISNTNNPKRDQNQFLVTGGPTGHKTQTQDTTTYHLLDALNNIIHNSSAAINHLSIKDMIHKALEGVIAHTAGSNIIHTALSGIISGNAQSIQQVAQNTITHAISGSGVFNMVASSFKFGAAGSSSDDVETSTFDLLDAPDTLDDTLLPIPPLPNLPVPSAQTLLDVIGSISASGNISAGGVMSAGAFGGSQGGFFPGAGMSGQVISSNITVGETITTGVPANVTFIPLTPGIWQVQGEVWFAPTAGVTAIYSAIGLTSATFPTLSGINTARTQVVFSSATPSTNVEVLSLRPCYVNITVNTNYYLICQAAFGGACTVTGNIWAVRI